MFSPTINCLNLLLKLLKQCQCLPHGKKKKRLKYPYKFEEKKNQKLKKEANIYIYTIKSDKIKIIVLKK
jgi:hypothetical protein